MKQNPINRIVVGFQYNQWWYSCHAGVILYLLDFAEVAHGQQDSNHVEASKLEKQP